MCEQLHDYDDGFEKFFDRLAADGINKSNTLFVFTVNEGDHFVGDQPDSGRLRRRHDTLPTTASARSTATLRRMIILSSATRPLLGALG